MKHSSPPPADAVSPHLDTPTLSNGKTQDSSLSLSTSKPVSTATLVSPQRGMLDFPPEEMRIHNFVADGIRQVCKELGFVEYDLPIVESWDVFAEKSSEELVAKQSYHFNDRSGRKLILRPEITPCLARMVARHLGSHSLPLRWFTIGRCYRYEKPQKGRLREFHQLNIDIIGKDDIVHDLELMRASTRLMKHFGITPDNYKLAYNNRMLADALLSLHDFSAKNKKAFFSLVDRCDKLEKSVLQQQVSQQLDSKHQSDFFHRYIAYPSLQAMLKGEIPIKEKQDDFIKKYNLRDFVTLDAIICNQAEFAGFHFSPRIVRGFDYYTAMVFEVFDASGDISRSIFGGGRYGNLIEKYAGKPLSAVGLGMGTHIFTLLLKAQGLIPKVVKQQKKVLIAPLEVSAVPMAFAASTLLLAKGFTTAVAAVAAMKTQFKKCEQGDYSHIALLGSNECQSQTIKLKNLESRAEQEIKIESTTN